MSTKTKLFTALLIFVLLVYHFPKVMFIVGAVIITLTLAIVILTYLFAKKKPDSGALTLAVIAVIFGLISVISSGISQQKKYELSQETETVVSLSSSESRQDKQEKVKFEPNKEEIVKGKEEDKRNTTEQELSAPLEEFKTFLTNDSKPKSSKPNDSETDQLKSKINPVVGLGDSIELFTHHYGENEGTKNRAIFRSGYIIVHFTDNQAHTILLQFDATNHPSRSEEEIFALTKSMMPADARIIRTSIRSDDLIEKKEIIFESDSIKKALNRKKGRFSLLLTRERGETGYFNTFLSIYGKNISNSQ